MVKIWQKLGSCLKKVPKRDKIGNQLFIAIFLIFACGIWLGVLAHKFTMNQYLIISVLSWVVIASFHTSWVNTEIKPLIKEDNDE